MFFVASPVTLFLIRDLGKGLSYPFNSNITKEITRIGGLPFAQRTSTYERCLESETETGHLLSPVREEEKGDRQALIPRKHPRRCVRARGA